MADFYAIFYGYVSHWFSTQSNNTQTMQIYQIILIISM